MTAGIELPVIRSIFMTMDVLTVSAYGFVWAQCNPAVTLSLLSTRNLDLLRVLVYIGA